MKGATGKTFKVRSGKLRAGPAVRPARFCTSGFGLAFLDLLLLFFRFVSADGLLEFTDTFSKAASELGQLFTSYQNDNTKKQKEHFGWIQQIMPPSLLCGIVMQTAQKFTKACEQDTLKTQHG